MKKCLVLILLILTVSSVGFADDFDIGLTGGLFICPDFGEPDASEMLTLFGGGLHLGWSMYFDEGILDGNLGIGAFLNAEYHYGTYKYSRLRYGIVETVETDPFKILMGTILLGPVYKVFDNGNFSLPVAVGAFVGAYKHIDDIEDNSKIHFSYGAGLNVTPQIKLNDTMHFFARVQAGVDFNKDHTNSISPIITLSPGIGFTPGNNAQPRTASEPRPAPPPSRPPARASQARSSPSPQTASKYFVSINKQNFGPCDIQQLLMLVQLGSLKRETLVWKEGMAEWAEAGTLQELSSIWVIPPPLPQ